MFYKPFSVLNPISKDSLATEDDMAIDFPTKENY
jgi:hypothetical protein